MDGGDVITSVCLPVSRISQKVVDEFGRNLVDIHVGHVTRTNCFGFREDLHRRILNDSSPLRAGAKNDISKSCGQMTKLGG